MLTPEQRAALEAILLTCDGRGKEAKADALRQLTEDAAIYMDRKRLFDLEEKYGCDVNPAKIIGYS